MTCTPQFTPSICGLCLMLTTLKFITFLVDMFNLALSCLKKLNKINLYKFKIKINCHDEILT